MNQQSQLFKSKLQEMKKQCYEEMNQKYTNILQEKIKEIHNTILKDVEQQNQQIIDNYIKKFEELEQKREEDFNQMSKILINNEQQKEGEIIFSLVKTTHHGIKCNKCGKEPIIGFRFKCSVCNYNLCEGCENKNSETQEHKHNFIKMRNEEKNEEKNEKKIINPKKENAKEEKKINNNIPNIDIKNKENQLNKNEPDKDEKNKNKNEDKVSNANAQLLEDERIVKFRKEFFLDIKDYSTQVLLEALKKNKFDYSKAFESLFNK